MAVNDPTTNYGWDLPLDQGDDDLWGIILNDEFGEDDPLHATLGSIDTVLFNLDGEVQTLETRIDALENRVLIVEALNQDPKYARVYLGANFPLGTGLENTPTDIPTWTEDLDVGGLFAPGSPSRLTIPADSDGIYGFRAVIRHDSWKGSGDDHSSWVIEIRKNDTDVVGRARVPYQNDGWEDDSGDRVTMVECLDNATAGDFYDVQVTYNDFEGDTVGQTIKAGIDQTYFEAVRLPSPVVPTTVHWSALMAASYWQHITGAEESPSTTVVHQEVDIYYRPFMVHRNLTVSKAGFRLSGAMTNETNVRIGIYDSTDAVSGRLPNNLLGETGDINLNGSPAGPYEAAFGSTIDLQAGTLYWIAMGHNRVSGAGGITCNAVAWGGDHYGWHFGHATAASCVGTSHPQGFMRSIPASWGPGLPDPADLTGRVIGNGSTTAIALFTSA